MKTYYIVFYNGGKAVCGTWQRGKDKEDACLSASFKLICTYPNILFDGYKVTEERD